MVFGREKGKSIESIYCCSVFIFTQKFSERRVRAEAYLTAAKGFCPILIPTVRPLPYSLEGHSWMTKSRELIDPLSGLWIRMKVLFSYKSEFLILVMILIFSSHSEAKDCRKKLLSWNVLSTIKPNMLNWIVNFLTKELFFKQFWFLIFHF